MYRKYFLLLQHGDGAHISWDVPLETNGKVVEYSVYLAVKNNAEPVSRVGGLSPLRKHVCLVQSSSHSRIIDRMLSATTRYTGSTWHTLAACSDHLLAC